MKKFFKSMALCLVVAVFAICCFAGCGKKDGKPAAETISETISADDLLEYFETEDVYAEFVDGFNVTLKIENNTAEKAVSLEGTVLLYAKGVDVYTQSVMLSQPGIQMSGSAYCKDGDVYADVNFAPKFWVEDGFSVDAYALQQQEIFSSFVEIVKELPNINNFPTTIFERIFDDAAGGAEIEIEKVTNIKTGATSYVVYFDDVHFVKFGFNKFHELSFFEIYTISDANGDEQFISVEMLEVGHDTRIPFPDGYEDYHDATAREE